MSSTVFRGLLARSGPTDEAADQRAAEHSPQSQQLSDELVMSRIQAGDQPALGLLFDRYSRLVLSVALRILHDTSEAQELVQDVFLYVFNKAIAFDAGRGSLRSWLLQIAYSRAFDRRDYLTVRRFYDYCQIDEIIDSVPSQFCLENQGEISELREVLRTAFAALEERQQTTLNLFFFEGYSLKEISVRLDETLGNTRHHYYRGLEKLRELIGAALAPVKAGKSRI
jgi:RNA polymerase sigma-70 factor, ECF subfamily